MEDDGDEDDADNRTPKVGSSVNPRSGHTRPFILPQMWTVNDFLPKMTSKIFKSLRDCFQIPDHIPICLPRKFKICYSGETKDTDVYDTIASSGVKAAIDSITPLAGYFPWSIHQPNRP